MISVLELAKALIARPSVTPEDAGCQAIIAEQLQAAGFQSEVLRYDNIDNLWAVHGKAGPLLVFAGHTDVVPPGPREQWIEDPFNPVVKDGLLYGRGAADMKGGLAAMIVAARKFTEVYPAHPGRLAFLITGDEEGPAANGTVKVVAELRRRGENIDWCIVGEPSSREQFGDTVRNGRRGSLSATLTVHGIQGHVAYPERTENPVHRVLPALNELLNTVWDTGNADFPATSLQVSNFNAGTGAGNVIPGSASIRFNFRYSPSVTAAALQQRTESILRHFKLRFDLEWHMMGEPFLTAPGRLSDAVAAAIEKTTGTRPAFDTGGGTSDGRFIAPTGAEVVEFGPLNSSIHQINECVAVADLETLAQIYFEIMQTLLVG